MEANILILNLLGAVALLLWGLQILKTGMQKAMGIRLPRLLATGTKNRLAAFWTGLVTTVAVQSSTVTAILLGGFVADGLVSLVMAQAAMLGANVGTSLVTQILALGLHWLSPLAILVGFGVFKLMKSSRGRASGEALFGLGLMLLSLQLLEAASQPMQESAALQQFMMLLGDVPVVAVLMAAALATAAASSLAIVLFVMALASSGHIGAELCLLLVAGANLGGAVTPFLAAARGAVPARRLALANLIVRAIGAVAVASTAWLLAPMLAGYALPRLVVDTHVAFNIVLALIFLPLIGPVARLVGKVLPIRQAEGEGPKHLDEEALSVPSAALVAATRETLRVSDTVEQMLTASLQALSKGDERLCEAIGDMDDKVDELQEAIKLYLSRLGRGELSPEEMRRATQITTYAVNLEHIGDIVQKNLVQLALKRIRQQLPFSSEGFAEIENFYRQTIENLRLAQTVFMAEDVNLARKLVEGKVEVRHLEKQSSENHLRRLREGRVESIQTSSLHLDILRDLKRINAHIAALAYPLLEDTGELRESRLRSSKNRRKLSPH